MQVEYQVLVVRWQTTPW